MATPPEIAIRPLAAADLPQAAVLLHILNPDTPAAVVGERLATILAEHAHYQLIGAFAEDRLVGVAAAWIATKIWCGRYLEIDNLVVHPDQRTSGIGSLLMAHLEEIAHASDCKILVLDSYVSNHPSHRLYHRLGFEIWGFHFVKPIGDWKGCGNEQTANSARIAST
ncbi:MAG: GNAT family N-acetyltransferase [Verrucomicrobiota bacterium]